MTTKTYVVRGGFTFRQTGENGNVKNYSEGDQLDLDTEIGGNCHQLELASEKDRAAAFKAEQAAKASTALVPTEGGISQEALQQAIDDGVARALAGMQSPPINHG